MLPQFVGILLTFWVGWSVAWNAWYWYHHRLSGWRLVGEVFVYLCWLVTFLVALGFVVVLFGWGPALCLLALPLILAAIADLTVGGHLRW